MAVIDLKNATITISDGSGTTKTVTVKVGDGTISFTETQNVEYLKDKGALDSVRLGDEEPVEVSLDIQWEYYTGPTTAETPVDAITGTGGASDWVTSATDTCEPYAVDITILNNNPCSGTNLDESILLSDFRWESLTSDVKAGTIQCRGRCNVTRAVATRS